jgi:serine/threonine protein kinase
MTRVSFHDLLLSRQGQPFSEAEVTTVLRQVLPQLVYYHDRNQAHGNISLATLLFDLQTGQASPSERSEAAPETAITQDIYNLGITTLALLSGRSPADFSNLAVLVNWQEYCLVSDQLSQVLNQSLQSNMGFLNASQMLQALDSSHGGTAIPHSVSLGASTAVPPATVNHPQTRPIWLWGVLGAVGATVLCSTGYAIHSLMTSQKTANVSAVVEPLSSTSDVSVPKPSRTPSRKSKVPDVNVAVTDPAPEPSMTPDLEGVNYQNEPNPFATGGYPKAACGDALPSARSTYPINIYGVFIHFSEQDISRVRAQFCQDALRKSRPEVGDLGVTSIQVASFSSRDRANQFREFISNSFSSAEVGEPRYFAAPP